MYCCYFNIINCFNDNITRGVLLLIFVAKTEYLRNYSTIKIFNNLNLCLNNLYFCLITITDII